MASLFGLDPATYRPHDLHVAEDRAYLETNCYMDVIIELLHARGDEPLAAMGSTVRLDFEGDQWTFFKPDPADLERLYGIDIHEMQPWRSIPTQIAELLGAGRTLTVELDAWLLPDTASTSYRTRARQDHGRSPRRSTSKGSGCTTSTTARCTSSAATTTAGSSGSEARGPTCCRRTPSSCASTPVHGSPAPSCAVRRSTPCAATSPTRRPTDPFARFGERLAADLPGLLDGDAATYHAYAFATVRMAGAGFELLRVARRLAARRRGRTGARGARRASWTARRCSGSGWLAGGRSIPSRSSRDMSTAWADAMAALHRAVD